MISHPDVDGKSAAAPCPNHKGVNSQVPATAAIAYGILEFDEGADSITDRRRDLTFKASDFLAQVLKPTGPVCGLLRLMFGDCLTGEGRNLTAIRFRSAQSVS